MPPSSNSRKGSFVVARCSVVLLFLAAGAPAFAHGSGHGDGNHFSAASGGKSSGTNGSASSSGYHPTIKRDRPPLRKLKVRHSAVAVPPRKIRPPIVKPGSAKAPPFYICPGCANPNLPQGTPITEEGGGMHCTFINGLNSGCDPNIPDTGTHGSGGAGQGRHHLN